MKHRAFSLVVCVIALATTAAASAQVSVNVGVDPCGYGPYDAPPVSYQPYPYCEAPPLVYFGGGSWGRGRGQRYGGGRQGHSGGHAGGHSGGGSRHH
jgi:hypothetical protein